jgi:hypothetical protein
VELASTIIPQIGAICGVNANYLWILMDICLKVTPTTNHLPCCGLEVLSRCQIGTPKKIGPKKVNYNYCNYSKLHLVL